MKEIPEDRTHCDKTCFDRDYELRKHASGEFYIAPEDKLWPGTRKRMQQMDTISRLAKEMCPISYRKFISAAAYSTGLTPRKMREDYVEVLLGVGILRLNGGILQSADSQGENQGEAGA